jgi:hypothetical protein
VKRVPFIEAELTLLPEREGGRKYPLDLSSEGVCYRPHIVIGDASQREAIVGNGNVVIEEYLGVQFRPAPKTIHPGESNMVVMDLIYFPSVGYEKAMPGAGFTLREGDKIVGYGVITRRDFSEG